MEIRQLKYFLEVCRCRNITKAAQNLHISQQTLSRQIKEFEEELGVQLFIRSTQGVGLTRFAESLEAPAKKIVKTAADAADLIARMHSEEKVTVRLGFVHGDFNFHSALSPKVIFDWEQRFPQMELKIREYEPDELDKMLLLDEIELAYTNGDPVPNLCKIPVSAEPAYILMSSRNPLAGKKNLTLEDLSDQNFLISRYSPLPNENRSQLAAHLGFQPKFSLFNGTFEQGVEHVRDDRGIIVAGRAFFLSRNLNGLAAFPFPDPGFVFPHYLAYRKDRELPLPVRQFIKDLKLQSRKINESHCSRDGNTVPS